MNAKKELGLALYSLIFCVPAFALDLEEMSKAKDSPIQYSEEVGEYQLVWTKQESDGTSKAYRYPLKFDPFTGESLGSKRGSQFLTIDDKEVSSIHQKFGKWRSINDVKAEYGEPDKVWQNPDGSKQYDFKAPFTSIDLLVGVESKGELKYTIAPKEKRN